MIVLAGVSALLGVVLFHVALGMTVRANPVTRLRFARNAAVAPRGTIVMRAIGAGMIVLGAALLSTIGWYWAFVVVIAGPVAALSVIVLHNRKVVARSAGAE